ncbi:MAG: DNA-formamidopyrimidine glycosylase [Candidatus Levybacteria bacterium RIFCSPLOWO2_01_FULL_39_24]|nr:MAG: DNA-formamidopyrimidine glycosylase [Candidatus Levybacteria bacterium RIFCSPHIGHO2_01_FULL_40_16]OGH27789.1 MAG: DNA-formamidopyrimidine glycosylase [Candidatus Levybacteria bacterium RIFCSPHIGHO2_12_FULL_39_9]OGH45827.1 MAG: DNA-formamidopyrimidine glycosylase [Candidatus Levybacteria bacterium RIFCSPLOWO2_01_FULL_39_24]
MPELPEVEIIRLGLQKYLVGRKIEDVEVRVPKIFVGDKKNVIGATITGLNRIGKGLIIELDNDFVLAVHLKMTGQLVYVDNKIKGPILSPKVGGEKLPSKYSHIIFTLDNNSFLYYNDLRRFGWIKVVRKDKLMQIPFFKELGPEPLKDLTLKKFKDIVLKSNLVIKVLLMDQKKIGGIGNIYANDALFEARIDPRRSAKQISPEEIERLYKAILKVLQKGLDYGGSSDENFVNALGQKGNYQKHTLVYGRAGETCPVCGGIIQKIKLGGRGTYFCSKCQH